MRAGLIRRSLYLGGYFLRSLMGARRPLLGGIKLSHACNLTCRHCPFWRRTGDALTCDQAIAGMQDLYDRGVRLLIIEGGEPLLWRDGDYGLKDIIAAARALFFAVGITTNGTLPLELDPDIIWVSIDGLQPTHDSIRGPSFEDVMANIEASSHPAIYAHITINRLNYGELRPLIELLAPRVKGVTIQFHYSYDQGEDDLALAADHRREALNELIAMKQEGLPIADSRACLEALKDNTWKCRPWMIASIDPDGKLTEGCYVRNRGTISCDQCGFAAHAEISLAYGGRLGAILCGHTIFKRRVL